MSATANLAPFGEPGFSPKAWINAACGSRPDGEPLERFLAELEMRLQLGAEEIEASLAECSASALRRVPFAQQEVSRLKGDVGALQASTRSLLSSVSEDAAAAASAAAPLAALHTARTNMEAGCATLREAAELSGAFRRVEEVFAAGDLPRVADMLRAMARSLALVGDVPECREGRGRLAALEDRLQRQVEGRLGSALQANAGAEVASLAGLLLAVGRYASLESAFVASRMPLVSAVWDEAAAMLAGGSSGAAAAPGSQQPPAPAGGGGLAGGWLLQLYSSLFGLLDSDAAWLASCLAEQRGPLLLALTAAALAKLNKLVVDKLSVLHSTRLLAGVMGDVLVAARRLRELLGSLLGAPSGAPGGTAEDAQQARLVKLLLEPLEQQVSRYAPLEELVITAELSAPLPISAAASAAAAAAAPRPGGAGEPGQQQQQLQAPGDEELEPDVAQKLDAAAAAAFGLLGAALERCLLLTGGTELPALLSCLDKQLASYLQRLQAAVGIINARYSRLAAAGAPGADATLVLPLLLLARRVGARLTGLDAQLRAALAQAIPRLQQLAAAGLPPPGQHTLAPAGSAAASHAAGVPAAAAAAASELLPLRLAAFPGKLAPLAKLRAASSSPRYTPLPAASAAGAALADGIAAAVYTALMAPVAAALQPLPALPDWTAAVPGGSAGVMPGVGAVLPSFSAYPLPAVTAVGEYLMALPQQLEVLMADEPGPGSSSSEGPQGALPGGGEDEGGELAAEWLDKVVRGADAAYVETLLQVHRVSPAGAAQMAADAEYIGNVMSALAVAPSPALITAQLFAAAPADTWAEIAAGALAGGSADAQMLRAIAAQRGIAWSGEAAAPEPAARQPDDPAAAEPAAAAPGPGSGEQ